MDTYIAENCPNVDVVEAHCYVVDIRRTDHEQIRSNVSAHDHSAQCPNVTTCDNGAASVDIAAR